VSWFSVPWAGVTAGKLAGEVLELAVLSRGLPELRADADGERVAADAGEVFTEQVSCSPGMAGSCGADHFDVVAFPGHLLAPGIAGRRSGDGAEIRDGEPEVRVGVDGEAQCRGRLVRVGGSLRLPVSRGGLPVGGDHAAVVLDRRPYGGSVIAVAGGLAGRWLHDTKVARAA